MFRFTFWSNFTNKDVISINSSTNTNYTTFTISGLDAGGDTWDGGVFTYASGQTFTVAAVPEPTSGLLLLLGMAGLALRRKQA